MNGYARLNYATIVAWMVVMERTPSLADIEALLLLDAILLHPEVGES